MLSTPTRRGRLFRVGLAFVPILWLATPVAGQEEPGDGEAAWDVTDPPGPRFEISIDTNEGTWMSVDVSPDGQTLVFDMLGDIYSLPAAGGEATLVAGGPAMQRQPRFSPDGSQVLFLSDASGGDNLWVANADGTDAKQVTRETVNKLSNPAWAPDGGYVIAHKAYTQSAKMFGGSEIFKRKFKYGQRQNH